MPRISELIPLGFSATIAERLSRKLVRKPSGCIEWTGSTLHFGHGHMSRGSRGAGYEPTHRVAWMLTHGPIPDGLQVLHKCDNPPCCNVDHLFLGTQADNMRDMNEKGRHGGPRGERHRSAKLTDTQVSKLRQLAPKVANYAELGRMFGVSKQHARSLALHMQRRS